MSTDPAENPPLRFNLRSGYCSLLDDRLVFTRLGKISKRPLPVNRRAGIAARMQFSLLAIAAMFLFTLFLKSVFWIKIISVLISLVCILLSFFVSRTSLPAFIKSEDILEMKYRAKSFWLGPHIRIHYHDALGLPIRKIILLERSGMDSARREELLKKWGNRS